MPAVEPSRSPWQTRWMPSWAPTRVDLWLACFAALVQIGGTLAAAHRQPDLRQLDAGAFALLLAGPVALLWRRRYPFAVFAVTFLSVLGYLLSGYAYGPIYISMIIGFVTLVMWGHRLLAVGVILVGYPVFVWLVPLLTDEGAPSAAAAVGVLAWLLFLFSVGEVIRFRRGQLAEAAHARSEAVHRQASEERLRIARELHDVLAHNISLISVQSGIALHLLPPSRGGNGDGTSVEPAREALQAINSASKEALQELRAALEVLRNPEEAAPRTPAPALADVERLVARTRTAGLDVRMEVSGRTVALPPAVERAAYRIVQEALTNVVRHSGATRAAVRLVYGEKELLVEVDDDGRGRGGVMDDVGTGSGIAGMRQRATALGGGLEAGPRPGGGFRVRARVPVRGTT